ncbi:hypothetical protein [Desertibacillus haloalkaliphilus]|uniref:hypothetical protein n=1 Tax=Desertibacillus haloalkaliphilus TaxID=1328930 RepID=UPI001C26159C|nr:hypothetical protein [Desertibacillus haloalkaliphilus]MBU8905743.1 hypothetical protein [Desertibacillus haloalkaliphilus]
MRTDTGYDAIILAMKNESGRYSVFLLADKKQPELWLFEGEEATLKMRVRQWCKTNLPDELKMMKLNVKMNRTAYMKVKAFLQKEKLPYEVKKKDFYVRNKDITFIKERMSRFMENDEA